MSTPRLGAPFIPPGDTLSDLSILQGPVEMALTNVSNLQQHVDAPCALKPESIAFCTASLTPAGAPNLALMICTGACAVGVNQGHNRSLRYRPVTPSDAVSSFKGMAFDSCKGSFCSPASRIATTVRVGRSSPKDFSPDGELLLGVVAYRHRHTTGKILGSLLPMTASNLQYARFAVPIGRLHVEARFVKSRDHPSSAANDGRRQKHWRTGGVSEPSFVMSTDGHADLAAKQRRVAFRRSRRF